MPTSRLTEPLIPPAAEPMIFTVMVFFGAYLAYEAWRWYSGNKASLTRGQFLRRMFTGAIIQLDLLLWLLPNHLSRLVDLDRRELALAKIVCVMFAVLLPFAAMILAVREAAFIVRQYVNWRRQIIRGSAHGERRKENGSA